MTVLLCTTTIGYQTRAFEQAAAVAGVELIYAIDRIEALDDPWRARAIPVRLDDLDGSAQRVRSVAGALPAGPIRGVVAIGNQAVVLAARLARELGLSWHDVSSARVSRSKLLTRGRLLAADLPAPWFFTTTTNATVAEIADRLRFPCVLKPLGLSDRRGVTRVDSVAQLETALARLRALLRRGDARRRREPVDDDLMIEGFIAGREYAIEGVLEQGALRVLAIVDRPDPLDGPYFAETIQVTPTALSTADQRRVAGTVAHAAAAMGLRHGPIHAECRVNEAGVFVLEIAARPIGGPASRALRFATTASGDQARDGVSLEELLLRHAIGESLDGYGREGGASGVMRIPVPQRGYFKNVTGVKAAARVVGIDDVVITAKPDHLIEPLPEGGECAGFIFARATEPAAVVEALRAAHAAITFRIEPTAPPTI